MTTTPATPHHPANGTLRPDSPRRTSNPSRRTIRRWLVTFLGYPLGGYLAFLIVGPLDSTPTALAGGALTGAVLGLAQAWALGFPRRAAVPWVLGTAVGLAAGAAVGAAVTTYATDTTSLVVLGAVTGLTVGASQSALLIGRVGPAALTWPIVLAGAWALGWLVSEAVIGSSVDQHFYIFGSSGAIVVALLTTPLPLMLARRDSAFRRSAARPVRSAS